MNFNALKISFKANLGKWNSVDKGLAMREKKSWLTKIQNMNRQTLSLGWRRMSFLSCCIYYWHEKGAAEIQKQHGQFRKTFTKQNLYAFMSMILF